MTTVRCGALLLASLAAAPPFELPAPTGARRIGTTAWVATDATRAEPSAPGQRRQVRVTAWYPTDQIVGSLAPYLREGPDEAGAFARLVRAPAGAWDAIADVPTHALLDAVAAPGARLPVIVFSHGYGSVASVHTALLEDLASHGYAVLNVVHPYEVMQATRADGAVVSMVGDDGAPRPPYRDVIGEWGKEDAAMAAVVAAAGRDEQRQLLRQYFATVPKTSVALQRWVDDVAAVLDGLRQLPPSSPAGRLAARLDTRRIGAAGHSMGGVMAAEFCLSDRRCAAALNFDGVPQHGSMIDRTMPAPMLMVYSARPERLGASDAIYARAASRYYRVDVRGTLHLDFADFTLWGGRLSGRGLGPIGAERATVVTRTVAREYFDQELRGRKSPMLAGETSLPELTVQQPHR